MKSFKVGKLVFPGQLQTRIFARVMTADEMKWLHETYENAKFREVGSKEPSETDYEISKSFLKLKDKNKVAKQFSVKPAKVMHCVRKVALYTFLNK